MPSPDSVIDSYAHYLLAKYRKACRQFVKRSREAQLAEAMVFGILQRKGAKPELADQHGGPDFLCADGKFVVEATAFTVGKVVSVSAMPDELPGEVRAHTYQHLTRQISERAGEKNSQLSVGLSAVLAIVCDHVIATLLFGTDAAQFLVTSEPFWIADKEEPSVDLSLSAFLRLEPDGTILPYNRNVSAVILVAVTSDASYLCGAHHPHPEHRFDSGSLYEIPFVYTKDWPIENMRIRCTWTMGTNPRPLRVEHHSIRSE
jgi:hypothetical protein